jgi:hypothetical protein
MSLFKEHDTQRPSSFEYISGEIFEEQCLNDNNLIEALNIFLIEIELLSNDNIDLYKYKIQSLLKKFEEIELELDKRYKSYKEIIEINEDLLLYIKCGNFPYTTWKSDEHSKAKHLKDWTSILISEIEKSQKIISLIPEIRERKWKLDQRLQELGI